MIDMVRLWSTIWLFLLFVLSVTWTMNEKSPGSGILKLKASIFWAALWSRKALVDLNLAVRKGVQKGPVFQWQGRVTSLSTLVMWWCCCVEKDSEAAFRLSSGAPRVIRTLIRRQVTSGWIDWGGESIVCVLLVKYLGMCLSVGKSRLLGRRAKQRLGTSLHVLGYRWLVLRTARNVRECTGSGRSRCSPDIRAGLSWLQKSQKDKKGLYAIPCRRGSDTHWDLCTPLVRTLSWHLWPRMLASPSCLGASVQWPWCGTAPGITSVEARYSHKAFISMFSMLFIKPHPLG